MTPRSRFLLPATVFLTGASVLIVEVLADIAAGRARSTPQPERGVSYASKIDKQDTRLDWAKPAAELERAVRAFRPAPGAWTLLDGEPIKVWRARIVNERLAPGELGRDLTVGCGDGALQLVELQRAGGKKLAGADYLRGHPVRPGARLG